MTALPCHRCCQTSLISRASDGGEREKHNFTLSHLLTLPSLSFSIFLSPSSHQTCPFCILLWRYLSVSHLHLFFYPFFLLSFPLSTLVTLCFKAALPRRKVTLTGFFRFSHMRTMVLSAMLFLKWCLLCTAGQSKVNSERWRLLSPIRSPSVSSPASSARAIIVKRILTRPRWLMNCYSQSSL